MRRAILTVHLDVLANFLNRNDFRRREYRGEQTFSVIYGIPDDAKIIDIRPNCAFTQQVDLLVESEEFREILPGCTYPALNAIIFEYSEYATYLNLRDRHQKMADDGNQCALVGNVAELRKRKAEERERMFQDPHKSKLCGASDQITETAAEVGIPRVENVLGFYGPPTEPASRVTAFVNEDGSVEEVKYTHKGEATEQPKPRGREFI